MLPESVNSPNPFSETASGNRAPFYDILAALPNVASRPCVAGPYRCCCATIAGPDPM
jgi:hypothetical protein